MNPSVALARFAGAVLAPIVLCVLACATHVAQAQTSTATPRKPPATSTLRTRPAQPPQPPPQQPTIRANPQPPQTPDDKRTPPPPPPPPSNVPLPDPNTPTGNPAVRGQITARPPAPPPEDPSRAGVDTADPGADAGTASAGGTPPTGAPGAPGIVAPAPASEESAAAQLAEIPGELLIVARDVAEAEAQRQWFASQGIGVLRRRTLGNLRWVLTVYRVPAGTDLPALLQAVIGNWPDAFAEPNRRYLPLAAEAKPPAKRVMYAAALVSLPPQGCASPVRIAMLDGPVNVAAFPARSIETVDIAERSAEPRYDHASGIAALWLANDVANGVLPNAELFAANVFADDDDGRPFTTTEWVVRGLDWVLGLPRVPPVVNLSFGGPDSALLARAIERTQESARVIAAGGNDGTDAPVYPAAYSGVVAVTAVDAIRKRWSRANTGDHIAVAAPGVEVWTIDGAGRGYYASGTSFASAFVTAALALRPPQQEELEAWLRAHTADLGTAGRDPQFGFGLLQAGGLCR